MISLLSKHYKNRANSLFERGIDLYKNGKYEDALNIFEETVVKYKKSGKSGNKDTEAKLAVLYRHIGNCQGALGNNQKAVELFEISMLNAKN